MPRVLLADNDPIVLDMLGDNLKIAGYEVETASNGVEALELARKTRPDVIILDVGMPDLNGYQACSRIKEEWHEASVPVVLLSSKDSEESRFWGEEVHADLFLAKQIGTRKIVRRIRELVA